MAQTSKFSGALANLRPGAKPREGGGTNADPPGAVEVVAARPAPPPSPPMRGPGRPHGKRSNPAFKPTTLYLRKQTKRAAVRLLQDREDSRDLSELVEDLLLQWTQRR